MDSHSGIHGLDPIQDIHFTVKRTHRGPLSRQIEEAALITWGLERGVTYGPGDTPEPIVSLNRKEEMFGPRVRFS